MLNEVIKKFYQCQRLIVFIEYLNTLNTAYQKNRTPDYILLHTSYDVIIWTCFFLPSRTSFAAFYRDLRFARDFRKYLNNLISRHADVRMGLSLAAFWVGKYFSKICPVRMFCEKKINNVHEWSFPFQSHKIHVARSLKGKKRKQFSLKIWSSLNLSSGKRRREMIFMIYGKLIKF